jgi:hypothetical protein
MKLSIYASALAAAAGLFLLAPHARAQSAPRMPANFQILLTRSIFSREALRADDRGRAPKVGFHGSGGPPVYIGAVEDDQGQRLAFLEDPQTGETAAVAIGQRIEQGTARLGSVEQITLDYMILRPDGGGPSRRIETGQTLTGEERADLSTGASADATTQPAGAAPIASSSGSATDPREILRQRRLRELQGR